MCASIARERQMRIYENVTRAIIEEMERGAVPWVRPWKSDRSNTGSVMPGNAITGRSYSGINAPILWASADSNGYLPRERAPSTNFPTSVTVRYSRGRRFAFKSRRGGTVPLTVFGAGLRLLLFAAEIRVFTKGTVPIKALFGTVEVYHAHRDDEPAEIKRERRWPHYPLRKECQRLYKS